MKKISILVLAFLLMSRLSGITLAFAAEDNGVPTDSPSTKAPEEQPIANPEKPATTQVEMPDLLSDYAYGTIKELSNTSISILEYDVNQGKQVETTYEITPDTETKNVESVANLSNGDVVSIKSITKNGQKIALSIEQESPAEADSTDSGTTITDNDVDNGDKESVK